MKIPGMLILLGTLAVCLGSQTLAFGEDSKALAEVVVTVDNFSFSPSPLTIKAGTTVRWKNRDDIPHTIVADDKSFKSKVLDTDEEFTYTFTKPGNYGYFCSIHPHMTGKVVVQ